VAEAEAAVAAAGSGLPCEKTHARMGPAPEEVASVSVVSGSRWRTPDPFAWGGRKSKGAERKSCNKLFRRAPKM
jgi:hypothetical protein